MRGQNELKLMRTFSNYFYHLYDSFKGINAQFEGDEMNFPDLLFGENVACYFFVIHRDGDWREDEKK